MVLSMKHIIPVKTPRKMWGSPRRPRWAGGWAVEGLEGRRLLSASRVSTPLAVAAEVGRRFDLDGNGIVSTPRATIVGQTAPWATVRLDRGADGSFERATRADDSGRFTFSVALTIGRTPFRIRAAAGGEAADTDLTATRGDAVIVWNETLLNAIRADVTGPPQAARALAMVHLAMYDAVQAATGSGETYHFAGSARPGTSAPVAASQAAYRVMLGLFPKQAEILAAARSESLAAVPRGPGRRWGIRLGDAVGADMIALRANDGSSAFVAYNSGVEPGDWVPTPPRFLAPLAPQWPNVTPFVIASGSQFRPGPPPDLASVEYAEAYNEVKLLGAAHSTARTPDQTALSKFWSDLPGTTFTPPGHWNQIAQDAALRERLGLVRTARLFAVLDAALADAGICCWDAKYAYDFWRPVTAIRQGDLDGNPETAADPTWTPLWATPNFQSYTSGHSTFSGAAQAVLESVFGREFSFSDAGDPTLGLPERSFVSLEQAAEEAGMSRVYGGIHFQFDNMVGLHGGRALGRYVVDRFGR